jgi:hypothetical protein
MIYFIGSSSVKDKPIKIGYSRDMDTLKNRIPSIQTSCPYELQVLCFEEGDINKEKEYHKLFKEYNSYGEWFNPSDEILNKIEEIRKNNPVEFNNYIEPDNVEEVINNNFYYNFMFLARTESEYNLLNIYYSWACGFYYSKHNNRFSDSDSIIGLRFSENADIEIVWKDSIMENESEALNKSWEILGSKNNGAVKNICYHKESKTYIDISNHKDSETAAMALINIREESTTLYTKILESKNIDNFVKNYERKEDMPVLKRDKEAFEDFIKRGIAPEHYKKELEIVNEKIEQYK